MPTPPPGTPDIDLTVSGNFGDIGGAAFTTGQFQPAGSGAFNSFVQIQNNGTEQGYNTDASPQYDEKNSHNNNHSILLADVPIVVGDGTNGTSEGVLYREFLLDLNEPNGGTKRYLSLDSLQIWQERRATSPISRPARDLPVPTPTIWPTISMQALIAGSRSPTGCRTAAGKATTAS